MPDREENSSNFYYKYSKLSILEEWEAREI